MGRTNGVIENWLEFKQFKEGFEKKPVYEYPNNVITAIPRPKVSVRITTYQHVNYIRDAIESVMRQSTNFPYEVIIGDDDSRDGTREICLEYAKKFPNKIRLFLHNRINNIAVLGRPTGIFQICYNTYSARGVYITGCSGDDFWQDNYKLQKQYEYLEREKKISFVYHDHLRLHIDCQQTEGPFNVERIQTAMGRNVFNKLPKEFLRVMQEDTFFKFIWKQYGDSAYMGNIKPNVIRFHSKSMYSSLPKEKIYEQRINLWQNIIHSYLGNRQSLQKAKIEFFKVIFYFHRNNNNKYLLVNIFNLTQQIIKYKLIRDAIPVLFALLKNKVFRLIEKYK